MVDGIGGIHAASQADLPAQAQGLALGHARRAAEVGDAHGRAHGHTGRPDPGPDAIVTISRQGRQLADAARHAARTLEASVVSGGSANGASSVPGHRMPRGIARKLTGGAIAQATSMTASAQPAPAPTPIRALGSALRTGADDDHGAAWGRRLRAGQLGAWSNAPRRAVGPDGPRSIHEIVQRAAAHTVDHAHRQRATQAADASAEVGRSPKPPHAASPSAVTPPEAP